MLISDQICMVMQKSMNLIPIVLIYVFVHIYENIHILWKINMPLRPTTLPFSNKFLFQLDEKYLDGLSNFWLTAEFKDIWEFCCDENNITFFSSPKMSAFQHFDSLQFLLQLWLRYLQETFRVTQNLFEVKKTQKLQISQLRMD